MDPICTQTFTQYDSLELHLLLKEQKPRFHPQPFWGLKHVLLRIMAEQPGIWVSVTRARSGLCGCFFQTKFQMLLLLLLLLLQTTIGQQYFLYSYGGNRWAQLQFVTVDSVGSIIITGYADSEPLVVKDSYGSSSATYSLSGHGSDIMVFVIKYSSTGSYIWHRVINGNDNEIGFMVKTTSTNDVVLSGNSYSTLNTVYDSSGNSLGSFDCGTTYSCDFLVKFSSNGNLQYSITFVNDNVSVVM